MKSIYSVHPAVKRGWADGDPDQYLESAERYIEEMFSGGKAKLRPLYDALLKLGLKIGKEAKACPCQTIVPLYRKHVFAQIKPTTQTRIDMGFALGDMKPTGRLIDTAPDLDSGVQRATEAARIALADQRLPGDARRFQVLAAVMAKAEIEGLARHRLADRVGVPVELVVDGGANEIRPVGVEAVLHHQVDMAEIDIAEIDRDLFAVRRSGPQLLHIASHHQPSLCHPTGW